METSLDPMLLGPLMIGITVVWFSWMFWSGMREDDTPRRPTRQPVAGDPMPWWADSGFETWGRAELTPVPVRVSATHERRRD